MKDQGNTHPQYAHAITPLIPIVTPDPHLIVQNELFNRIRSGGHKIKETVCSIFFLRHALLTLGPILFGALSVFLGATILSHAKPYKNNQGMIELQYDPEKMKRLTHALGWEVGALSGVQTTLILYAVFFCCSYCSCCKGTNPDRLFAFLTLYLVLFFCTLPTSIFLLEGKDSKLVGAASASGSLGLILLAFSLCAVTVLSVLAICCTKKSIDFIKERIAMARIARAHELTVNTLTLASRNTVRSHEPKVVIPIHSKRRKTLLSSPISVASSSSSLINALKETGDNRETKKGRWITEDSENEEKEENETEISLTYGN